MTSLKSIVDRAAPLAYAPAAWLAGGITKVFDPNRSSGEDVVGVLGYLGLGFFALALILTAPLFLALARRAGNETGARAAGTGTLLLGLTCVTSVVNGHDLSFFIVLAPLTNALWLFGSIALSVSLRRAGRVPTHVWVGLPLVWVVAIPLGTLGFGALASLYWFAIGQLLDEREGIASAAPAAA